MPELEEIFGPDIAFDLREILIERFGDNMRNEFAHGLMPEGAFYQPTADYLWWLVLHLCVTHYVQTREISREPGAKTEPPIGKERHDNQHASTCINMHQHARKPRSNRGIRWTCISR